jgi:RNA polymerase sigma factor (sigma-70 family)
MLHTGGHILKNLRVSIFNSTRFFVAVVHHQYSRRRKNDGSTEMIKKNDGISKDDICQNQFTAYVVLAVKRKRQSYIKKKQREHEKETRTKKEAEQSEFRTAGYDMWSRMEPQNEKLMAAMQQLSLKERFVVTEYVLKGKPFKEIAQETGLKEKGVASAYYRSIKKLRAEMGDVK